MSRFIQTAQGAELIRCEQDQPYFTFGTNAFGDVDVLVSDLDNFIALAHLENEAASFENLVAQRDQLQQLLRGEISQVTWSIPGRGCDENWVNLATWMREQQTVKAQSDIPGIWWSDLD